MQFDAGDAAVKGGVRRFFANNAAQNFRQNRMFG
jgi:hypothetical protein